MKGGGRIKPSAEAGAKIIKALEDAGIEFLEGGVRLHAR
jgi:hypothetical protein